MGSRLLSQVPAGEDRVCCDFYAWFLFLYNHSYPFVQKRIPVCFTDWLKIGESQKMVFDLHITLEKVVLFTIILFVM